MRGCLRSERKGRSRLIRWQARSEFAIWALFISLLPGTHDRMTVTLLALQLEREVNAAYSKEDSGMTVT